MAGPCQGTVLSLGVALVVVLAGCGGTTATGDDRADATVTPADVPEDGPDIVPGVSDGTVGEPERLATAHRRSLETSSFRVVRTRRVRNASGETMNSVLFVGEVTDSASTYNVTRVEQSVHAFRTAEGFARIDAWAVDTRFHGRFIDEAGVVRTWTARSRPDNPSIQDIPRGQFVTRAFTAFDVAADGSVTRDGETRYRFAGGEIVDPEALPAPPLVEHPTNASLVAVVDVNGVVHRLSLSYDARYAGIPVTIAMRLRVEGVGETEPRRPEWVNETETETATADGQVALSRYTWVLSPEGRAAREPR